MAQLYAIAGDMARARLFLAAGVPYLQLRFKAAPLAPHRAELAEWPARYPATRLIINDDLDAAEALGAWGAHLGQEDLARHAPARVRESPVHVGISTHSDAEIAHALTFAPSLLGFGPIFPTSTKVVQHAPQGVAQLTRVLGRVRLPVVAIGGLSPENVAPVVATGVPLVAMISALDRCETVADLQRFMAQLAEMSPPHADLHGK